mgnify:CR=1 FL=1
MTRDWSSDVCSSDLDAGQYSVKEIYIDGNKYGDCDTVLKEDVMKLNDTVNIVAILD